MYSFIQFSSGHSDSHRPGGKSTDVFSNSDSYRWYSSHTPAAVGFPRSRSYRRRDNWTPRAGFISTDEENGQCHAVQTVRSRDQHGPGIGIGSHLRERKHVYEKVRLS